MPKYTDSLFWKTENPPLETTTTGMIERIENDLSTYEWTGSNLDICKLYFDFDYKLENETDYDEEANQYINETCEKCISSYINEKFNKLPSIAVATASYKLKYSWRYYIPSLKMKKNELLYFITLMNQYIENNSDIYDVIEKKGTFFDEGIYDKNRKIRCVNTSKPNENRPLVLVKGSIKDTLITADLEEAELINIPLKITIPSSPSPSSITAITDSNKHIDLLLMLGSTNYTRSDWVSICGWCHTYATKQMFLDFVNCDWRDEAEKMWNSMTTKDIPIYWIETFAKRINITIYKSWINKWNIYYIPADQLDDPFAVAKIISNTLKTSLVLCNEKWFMLTDKNLWMQQKESSFYIINELRKYIDESNKTLVYKISQTNGDEKDKLVEKSKLYLKSYKTISSSGFLNVLTKYLKTLLVDNSFETKLDNNSGFIAFKNGIINLETKEFRIGIQADDFISQTLEYDYVVAEPNKKQFVKNVLLKILNNNEEHLEYFLSLIGFSFIGNPHLQKSIYFCVDKTIKSAGDNGKTFFFDILEHLLPIYTYKTNKSFFEDDNKKMHKQLVNMKGKRLVYADEFNEKKVNAEFMKIISDGLKIENEIMFGTTEIINIMFKSWILTNHIPNIDVKEQAVYNRYKQLSYASHFDRTGTRLTENPEKLEFIADITLGDKIKNEYYNEVFELIIDYANQYYKSKLPSIPKQFLLDAEATKMKNDDFGSWFNDNCELDNNERIALKILTTASGFNEKIIKEGMIRLGFKYDKDLMKLGKDSNNKHYKGGFIGLKLKPEQLDEEE